MDKEVICYLKQEIRRADEHVKMQAVKECKQMNNDSICDKIRVYEIEKRWCSF